MSLPDDALERLLIDRELGEVSDDTALLIDAHLRSHPFLKASAHGTANTIRLVRSTMAGAPIDADLPLPRIDFRRAAHRARRMSLARGGFAGLAVAATLGLVAWIGFMLGEGRIDLSRDGIATNSLRPPALVAVRSAHPSSETGFWSADEVRRRASSSIKPPRTAVRHINWISPVARPITGASS